MNRRVQLYDSFTGLTPPERAAVVHLLCQNSDSTNGEEIAEALDYALKNRPSFGGYIFTLWENDQVISCVVVNQTGMGPYNPGYVLVYAVLHPDYLQEEDLLQDLVQRAVRHAKGEIAMHLRPNNPGIDLFKRMGFTEKYVELRLNPKVRAAAG